MLNNLSRPIQPYQTRPIKPMYDPSLSVEWYSIGSCIDRSTMHVRRLSLILPTWLAIAALTHTRNRQTAKQWINNLQLTYTVFILIVLHAIKFFDHLFFNFTIFDHHFFSFHHFSITFFLILPFSITTFFHFTIFRSLFFCEYFQKFKTKFKVFDAKRAYKIPNTYTTWFIFN